MEGIVMFVEPLISVPVQIGAALILTGVGVSILLRETKRPARSPRREFLGAIIACGGGTLLLAVLVEWLT